MHGHMRRMFVRGVDINPNLIEQAAQNMKILGIRSDLRCENAVDTNIDVYNLFFFYNPFTGKVFDKVINNIYENYRKHQREIFLVYGNPFEHETVMKYGFSLHKQIRVDLYDPILNIYRLGK